MPIKFKRWLSRVVVLFTVCCLFAFDKLSYNIMLVTKLQLYDQTKVKTVSAPVNN